MLFHRPLIGGLIVLSFICIISIFLYIGNSSALGSQVWHLQIPHPFRSADESDSHFTPFEYATDISSTSHPIDSLVSRADGDFKALLSQETKGMKDAAAAYRTRRGRHPPPLFDKWVQWAEEHGSMMIESLFDQIYDDLEPFWALPPSQIRDDAASWTVLLSIRNGTVRKRMPMQPNLADWLGRWQNMVEHIPSDALPDVDLAFNPDDEPHIFVPRKQISTYMEKARQSRHTNPPSEMEIISKYSTHKPVANEPTFEAFADAPSEPNLWLLARDTCGEDSEAQDTIQDLDFTTPPRFTVEIVESQHRHAGYISNWTSAKSVCDNPHLRNLHGYFVNPAQKSFAHWKSNSTDRLTTRILFPLFSACKLQGTNNDILVPSAMYWGKTDYFEDDTKAWKRKMDKVIWRGRASGQFNNETNWTRFHRHRFVSMMNSTQIYQTQFHSWWNSTIPDHVPGGSPPLPHNFPMPDPWIFPLAAYGDLSRWVGSISNVAFTLLDCWPMADFFKNANGRTCSYTSPFYNTSERVDFKEFFNYKYLPDLDGHAYSGRWRAFLASDSVPIKATIWAEWHRDRLLPWRHFVPMDNTFIDWWGILEYFIGYSPPDDNVGTGRKGKKGHDRVAKAIADQGRDWSAKVLRQEDILLYMWRVILEYARICDDNRQRMGWVEDLR